MSSLFESGITLVCIVILHNWFKEEILGTVTALWYSSYYLQEVVQQSIYNSLDKDTRDQDIINVIKYWSKTANLISPVFFLSGCPMISSFGQAQTSMEHG